MEDGGRTQAEPPKGRDLKRGSHRVEQSPKAPRSPPNRRRKANNSTGEKDQSAKTQQTHPKVVCATKSGENYRPKSGTCQGTRPPDTQERSTGRPEDRDPDTQWVRRSTERRSKNGNRNGSTTMKSIKIEGYGPPHNCAPRVQSDDYPTAPNTK